ncbi:hypothetical protein DX933_16750 [Ornithinibacillus gellani]|uniref:hypothetical protein n=1 Tax=Ornithinibacillus gellani TaxID=2293253 RepID=UPI000F46B45C|nr:hypothetical protein [Ornithinibacillus gellani]TQS71010.1 hypothetical protein DX933_16750 [Ornithinibacillus gellani]
MKQPILAYLAAILAGFALIVVVDLASSFITGTIASILIAIGAVAVVVFSLAIIILALNKLFGRGRTL